MKTKKKRLIPASLINEIPSNGCFIIVKQLACASVKINFADGFLGYCYLFRSSVGLSIISLKTKPLNPYFRIYASFINCRTNSRGRCLYYR